VSLDFLIIRIGILAANSAPRDLAGQFVHAQRDLQPFFAGHAPVRFDLAL
jgi:hypothetical protein